MFSLLKNTIFSWFLQHVRFRCDYISCFEKYDQNMKNVQTKFLTNFLTCQICVQNNFSSICQCWDLYRWNLLVAPQKLYSVDAKPLGISPRKWPNRPIYAIYLEYQWILVPRRYRGRSLQSLKKKTVTFLVRIRLSLLYLCKLL